MIYEILTRTICKFNEQEMYSFWYLVAPNELEGPIHSTLDLLFFYCLGNATATHYYITCRYLYFSVIHFLIIEIIVNNRQS